MNRNTSKCLAISSELEMGQQQTEAVLVTTQHSHVIESYPYSWLHPVVLPSQAACDTARHGQYRCQPQHGRGRIVQPQPKHNSNKSRPQGLPQQPG